MRIRLGDDSNVSPIVLYPTSLPHDVLLKRWFGGVRSKSSPSPGQSRRSSSRLCCGIRLLQLYISVPDHLLLGPEKLRADSQLFRSIEKIRDSLGRDFSKKDVFDALLHDQKTRLILLMLYEKNVEKDSLWSEYFDVLPKSVSVPALFNETELSALQGSEVAPAARKLVRRKSPPSCPPPHLLSRSLFFGLLATPLLLTCLRLRELSSLAHIGRKFGALMNLHLYC
jgi:hypothetical protein